MVVADFAETNSRLDKMVKVELDRQEAEALVDSAIKSLSVEFDYFTDNALMCLALACGMIKKESDYKDWKKNNILSIRSMHNCQD